jgi:predicted CxxxxCH...CXXCH cytochrome family protein
VFKKLICIVTLLLVLPTLAIAGRGAANSASCIHCHNGTIPIGGGTSNCGGCHANPPATGAHLLHTDGAGAIYGNDANSSVSTRYRFNCANCHPTNLTKHGNRIVDMELYNAAAAGFKKNNPAFAAYTGAGAGTVCLNIYCHSSGQYAGVNTYAATPLWGGTFSGNRCAGCHGYPPAYANNAPKANSHIPHSFACNTCHAGTTADGTTISNASLHVSHSYDLAPGSGVSFTYTYAPTGGTCNNISCHGNTGATWGGTAVCNACHGSPPPNAAAGYTGVNEATSPHLKHAGKGANYSYACNECHKGNTHANSTFQDVFIDKSGIIAGPAAAYTTGTRTCSTLYCHSDGTSLATGQTAGDSVVWGSGKLGCNGCHGFPPAYGNGVPKANSHSQHAYGCNTCHATTTSDGVSVTAKDNHVNKSYDVKAGLGASFNYSYAPSGGTCSTISCHGNTSATWGGTVACGTCHGNPPPSAAVGYTAVDETRSPHLKHAGQGASYSYACNECHKGNSHGTGTFQDVFKDKTAVLAGPSAGYDSGSRTCSSVYCHSDALGGLPTTTPRWSENMTMQCFSCHKGRTGDNTLENCTTIGGTWDADKGLCAPYVNMTSNGHAKLVGPQWIRKYPCTYCHNATVAAVTDANGKITDGNINTSNHVNGVKDVSMASQWTIVGKPAPTYNPATKSCDNVYCHSDGTTNPDAVKQFPWTQHGTECNSCHGHPRGSCKDAGCHDGRTDSIGNVWVLPPAYLNVTSYQWPAGQEWKAAMPMYPNQGAGTARANSHARHLQTNFTCDICHAATIRSSNGNTSCIGMGCHTDGQSIPPGSMKESSHLNGDKHVNKAKDLVFKTMPDGTGAQASYNYDKKTCSNTSTTGCHGSSGTDPQWGASVNNTVICLSCHGTTGTDADGFGFKLYSTQAKINLTNWASSGHGRPASAGPYPVSGNPAANFPSNPCWYCHDNNVIHNDSSNPFRLRQHQQFANRFNKECVYCHMVGTDSECLSCHNNGESLAPQLVALPADPNAKWPDGTSAPRPNHTTMGNGSTSCITSQCHYVDKATPTNDLKRHNVGAGLWRADQQADVKNQYLMMGVCLKCHDDDTGGKCNNCHTTPANNPFKYSLGFDPGTGFIKPQKARASSVHFGYKHNREYLQNGVWKGGKFCWDCHDPHGDSNIYMIQSQVATSTDGTFGIPRTRGAVVFTKKQSGLDYARITAPYNGICNVCHAQQNAQLSKHYGSDFGDGHNASRVCTSCHEHRFTDSHADNQPCNTCHQNKPVPRHSGFGQPRDCTKCHSGTIGMRMDVMGQMKGNSHHVQGAAVTNKQCYACHWESTPEGLIDVRYHEGYNYKTYSSVKNAKVDLVVWKPGLRPTYYNSTTAVKFLASNIGTANERTEAAKLTNVCISCHSDQNNDTQPFNDCKTPRQYAWDGQSVAARYSQTGTTTWGKYNSTTYPNANQKDKVTKAFSAHGNAVNNKGGYDPANGVDGAITNTRGGSQNVQCYDCHSSHGSKVVGTTSSYVTFNGTNNGANLKETQAGKGGYGMSYKASANATSGAVNPYSAGAGQCFDCHLTQNAGTTPWGYQSTYGATQPIKGYFDSAMFGSGSPGVQQRYTFKSNRSVVGGHLKAETMLNYTTSAQNKINGLCTPCHDPHGVSPTLGTKQAYAVPMLKGTWMTSPYKEDAPQTSTNNPPEGPPDFNATSSSIHMDQNTFGGARIAEDASTFAGLCLRCHYQKNLTNGTDHTWKSKNRVHEAVKGWKTADATIQHSYTCSKCHAPHTSGLPRLMITNCLDSKHRGRVASGGQAGFNSGLLDYSGWYIYNGSFPKGPGYYTDPGSNCHPTGTWPDNRWNNVTPW